MKHLILAIFFASFCPILHAQINWKSTNGPEGGSAFSLYSSPQYAFTSDEHHLYRTADGSNWEQLPYGNLWPIATSPTKMAAGQGYGYSYASKPPRFVISYDNGSTWIEGTTPPTKYGTFSNIAICSHGIYVPDGANGHIYRTQDDGLTWDTVVPPGKYSYDLWAFDDRLYAEWNAKFWRLATNGTDWELVSPNFGTSEYPNSMYASGSLLLFASENNLWASNNNGVSWKQTPIDFHNSNDHFVRIGNRIYKTGGSTGILYSDDFGLSWPALPISNDFGTYDLASVGGRLLCGTYNKGVFRLEEASNQLVPANTGLYSATVYYLDGQDDQLWAACGNGVFSYDVNTKKWDTKIALPIPQHYYEQVAVSTSGKIATFEWLTNRFYLSIDKGASWDTISPSFGPFGFGGIKQIDWLEEKIIVRSEFNEDMWSSDLGKTWQPGEFPTQIVSFKGKHYGINWSDDQLVSSTNAGVTWQTEQAPDVSPKYHLFATDDRLFIVGLSDWKNVGLYTSTDGSNWSYSSDGLPSIKVSAGEENIYRGGIWRGGEKYYFHEPGIGFFASLDSCKTWLPLQRSLYGNLNMMDSTFYAGSLGGGVVQTGLPQNYGSLSSGTVYKDDNNNGLREPGEIPMPGIRVAIKEPSAWYPFWSVYTQPDGRYVIGSTPGAQDSLRVLIQSKYVDNIQPPVRVVNGSGTGLDFGVHFVSDVTDVSVRGRFAGRPRPGFALRTHVNYANEGTLPANGKVSLKLDPKFQFITANPVPSETFSDSLVWDFAQIPLFERRNIWINGKLDSSVMIGSLLKMHGHIVSDLPDIALADNHFTLCDTVVGSYDPNEKRVEPAQGLTASEIAAGKELLYTVQFQNTGTFQADRVRITDHLDTALNVTTLRLLDASHLVSGFRLLPGGLLEIVFDNIFLPDSNANEPASHGFVTFAIQRNRAYTPTYKINNKAAIYFDFNEPIITNTVVTPLATPTVSTQEPDPGKANTILLHISPNPTPQHFTVETKGRLFGPGEITVLTPAGHICFRQQVADLSIPIQINPTGLSDGSYIVRASGKHQVLFGKLVILR